MSLTWKDTVATIAAIIVITFTVTLMMGAFDDIEARWALGTFAVFLVGGVAGLITGTAKMMRSAWSSIALYLLSIAAITITIVNAFLNSEVWFVAMAATITLLWLEFAGIDLFSRDDGTRTHIPGGTM
jgi:hypothetical protein